MDIFFSLEVGRETEKRKEGREGEGSTTGEAGE